MNKIRINVLARELEVKAHELLEKLPELGVTEKKTHSSSIDDDVAEKLRHIFGGHAEERTPQPAASNGNQGLEELPPAPPAASAPVVTAHPSAPAQEPARPQEPHAAPAGEAQPRMTPQTQRLRPPLATQHPPSAPQHCQSRNAPVFLRLGPHPGPDKFYQAPDSLCQVAFARLNRSAPCRGSISLRDLRVPARREAFRLRRPRSGQMYRPRRRELHRVPA